MDVVSGTHGHWIRQSMWIGDQRCLAEAGWGHEFDAVVAECDQAAAVVTPHLGQLGYQLDHVNQPDPDAPAPVALVAGIDIPFTAPHCEDCSALQVIQVTWMTPNEAMLPDRIGTLTLGPFPGFEQFGEFHACVDAGRNSPRVRWAGRPPSHPFRPYYYSPRSLRAETNGCSIRIFDQPNAVVNSLVAMFEAAVLCVNYEGSGRDRVVRAWTYSYGGHGVVHTPPQEQAKVSEIFKEIVAHDYPDYPPQVDW
jgi:hypothetical protein